MSNSALRIARSLTVPGAAPTPDLPPGLLVELSGDRETARLSAAVSAVRRAQAQGETVAWIQPESGSLYPPDLAEAGLDLDSLVVVRVPASFGSVGLSRATEILVRSGALGCVVVDARDLRFKLPPAWQGKLLGAVREHGSRILFLTSHSTGSESVGSLVGLRLEPRRVRFAPGLFAIEHHVLKNKPGLHFAESLERRRGPRGIR
ncbi:MAG TPA: recombinase A [bacterium]|nr:recombinase A [bacterium]